MCLQVVSALTKSASSLCASSKAQMLVMAVMIRSGMEDPPWSMRVVARNGGMRMQFLMTKLREFALMVILEISSGSFRAVKEVHVANLAFVVPKRTSLLSCAG